MKTRLTDKALAALKPAEPGKRYIIWDVAQQNFGVRVTDKGRASFVAVRRQAGTGKLIWARLGAYPAMSLRTARKMARGTIDALEAGENPIEARRERLRAQARRAAETFGAAVEEFLQDREVAKLRTARFLGAILRREFLGQKLGRRRDSEGKLIDEWVTNGDTYWCDRPVTSITRRDVIERIDEINKRRKRRSGGKYAAHHAFSACRRFFGWAIERDIYGIEASPCANINIKRLVGAKDRRDRVLTDAELRVVWRAASEMGQPFGPLVRALLLTGQRLSEIAGARWSEIDLEAAMLTVPAARMKMKQAHAVPLTPAVVTLLEGLPRVDSKDADSVFTTTEGRRPVSGFSKWKRRLDEAIARAAAEQDPPAVVPHFTLHDLRRTVRTRLSALGVSRTVAELTIGHAQQGIEAVYDIHTYDREKRDALTRWERTLLAIIESRQAEVTDLAKARAHRKAPVGAGA